MTKRVGLMTAVLMLGLAGLTSAATWNLADDFSTANGNPNGAWTYGWYQDGTANFTQYPTPASGSQNGSTYADWEGPAGNQWQGFVLKNQGPYPMTDWGYYEPGQVILHPSITTDLGAEIGHSANVRWTAPRDMTVDINALFTGQAYAGAGTTTYCYVIKNYGAIATGGIEGFFGTAVNNYADRFGTSFVAYSGQLTLQAGDFIDFAVGYDSNPFDDVEGTYNSDSTGLAVTITEVPEPATMGLLMLGGLLLRRKN